MARFFDGRTPDPHTLRLSLSDHALIGRNAEQEALLIWPFADIIILEKPFGTREAVLASHQFPEARLRLPPGDFEKLRPYLSIETPARHVLRWSLVSAGALAFIAAVMLGWPLLTPSIARMIPESSFEPMTRQAMDILVGDARECEEAMPRRSLEALVESLAQKGGYDGPVHLRVVKKSDANAFALPGGHLVLFSPVITQAESVDEIAGVIAHELGHLKRGHSREAIVRQMGINLVFQVMAGVDDASMAILFAEHVGEMHHSRKAEREADDFAIRTTAAAGYDPRAMADFFRRISVEEKESGFLDSQLFTYVSSHPATAERIERLEALPPGRKKASDAENLKMLKKMCGNPQRVKKKKKKAS